MKKTLLIFNFTFLILNSAFSQAGEWVWMKGDNIPNQPAVYGMQGVPGPTNNPPSLYETCEWTDLNGNFWLFGGLDANFNTHSDLWEYNPLTNEWTWRKGPGTPFNPGSYGVQGIPSPGNNPPPRSYGMATWRDNQGNLWMLGGANNGGVYNDLWKYNISTNEWTWMKGANFQGQAGTYGTMGVPSPLNCPGARSETSAAWSDNSGNLWLFGGLSLNDLWKYNISTNEWTWMKGSQLPDQPGVYGIMGIEDTANTPGSRMIYSHWVDYAGRLWLFAGKDFINSALFNDLWRFNINTNNWAWIGGDSTTGSTGTYGNKCIVSVNNMPRSRYENRSVWTDQSNNFYFFGGCRGNTASYIWNDLWKYCVSTNQWIWISGDSITNPSGHWGTLGVSNPMNKPNGRAGAVGWEDNNGHLYLFGGCTSPFFKAYNDLWKYTIDTTCGVCPTPNNIQKNISTDMDNLLVFPNPTNSSLIISFQSSSNQVIELRLYDTLGKQIYFSKQEITTGKFEKEIYVEKWSSGIYFLQLKTRDGVINKKIIVQH